jgi:glycosyltransferase involved in cell wall biosynthesis
MRALKTMPADHRPVDTRPLRIIHCFRAPLGGLFRHVLDLARAQIERGHAVGIFCDATTGGERATATLAELEPNLKLGLVRVPMSRYPSRTDFRAYSAANQYFNDAQPDIIHGHGSKGGVYARLPMFGGAGLRPVRAYTPHGGSFNYKPGSIEHKVYMAAERLLERRTDLFLFESDYISGRFDAYVGGTDRMRRVVVNGISAAEFEPIVHREDARDLLYIGELRTAKGVDTLIEALALIKQQSGRAYSTLIVGSGPDEDLLKEHVAACGLAEHISFAPPAPIRDALSRARAMAIPSRAESLPYVILEAAGAAQPLVATNVGGIPEIFGPHAWRLIPPDDAPTLARAISSMLDQTAEARARDAAELSAYVKSRFCVVSMVDGVINGYRAALAARNSFRAPVHAAA